LNKRLDIQYLRAVAVLGVLVFHAFPSAFPYGYLGVDLFFFLSGFLIFPQLLKAISHKDFKQARSDLKLFLNRRIRRIAPALGCSVAFFSCIGYFLLPPSSDYLYKQFSQSASAILGFGNLVALRNSGDYFNSDSAFVHYWTLGVEMQTYLLSAILAFSVLIANAKRSCFRNQNLFLFMLIILTFISVIMRFITLHFPRVFGLVGMQSFEISPSFFDFYFVTNRFWEFTAGGFAALISSNGVMRSLSIESKKVIKNLVLALIVILFVANTPIISQSIKPILLLLLSLTYLSISVEKDFSIRLFNSLEWVGDRSYSIYLYHLPFLVILGGSFVPYEYRAPLKILALFLTFIFGNISFRYVEEKFRYREFLVRTQGRPKRTASFFMVSYAIPLSLIFALIVLDKQSNVLKLSGDNWKKSYAASENFPCILGQLDSYCELNTAPSRKFWLLVGDSHAGAIQQTINNIAVSRKVALKVWNKCRFFNPAISAELNSYFPQWCLSQNEERIKVINSGDVSLLLVHYFNSRVTYGDKTLPETLWKFVFKKTLTDLKNNQTVLLGQVPVFEDSQYDRPRVSFPIRESVPIPEIASMSERFKNLEKEIARDSEIDYLDLSGAFCNQKECTRKGENWLYVDGNHLSITGAELIRPLIERFIDTRLKPEDNLEMDKRSFK
jgi:peptidoglycan/LPS O-acetylase OafA/YrhL